jgi:hypothetical protein
MTEPATRILAILDPDAGEPATVRALLERDAGELYIISPVLPTRLGWLTNDDGDAVAEAESHLSSALAQAEAVGVEADGIVGTDDDLLTVIGDALAQFPADEIVLVTHSDAKRHWRVEELAKKVDERHGKPMRALVLAAESGRVTAPRDHGGG